MKFIVERLPDCRASLRVDVPAGTVDKERNRIVKAFSQQAKVPGFRPGKVPSKVIEKRYTAEIQDELKNTLIRQGCNEGIKEEKLEVLHVADIQDAEFALDDGSFAFTALLQTAPDFEVPDYVGIPVELPKVDVTDHDIDHQMEHLAQRLATFDDVDKEVESDDFVVLNYNGFLDDKPLEEISPEATYIAKGEEQWLRVDEQSFLPGFCEQLQGLKAGEEKEFDVAMPEESPIEELKGKSLTYKVEIKAVKQQVIPEWTDELAQQVEDGGTVETLREKAGEQIKAQQEGERDGEMTTQILEFLDKELEFELPEDIVQSETQRQVNDLVQRGQMQGMTDDQLMEQQEDIFKHAATQAQVNVKTGFILSQIAEKEKIEASQDELLGAIAQMAQQNNQPFKKFLKQVQKDDQVGSIANRIVTSKTLDFLREKASVTEVDRPPHECDNPDHQHGHGDDHDHDDQKDSEG